MTTTWPLDTLTIVGGHVCPRPPAPFGRGPAVVQRGDDDSAVMIAYKLTGRAATGDVVSRDMWRRLCASDESVALITPLSAVADAAVWVFTSKFGDPLRSYFNALGTALLAVQPEDPEGPRTTAVPEQRIAVVVEKRVKHLRRTWADRAYAAAMAAIRDGKLDLAELHAARCFSLLPLPEPREYALMAFIARRRHLDNRSDSFLELARNTHGQAVHARVLEVYRQLAQDLPERPPALLPPTTAPSERRFRLLAGSND